MPESTAAGASGLRADLALGVVTLLWGSSFVVVRHALDDAPPLALLFWRFLARGGARGAHWRPGRPKSRPALSGRARPRQLSWPPACPFRSWDRRRRTASKAGFLTGLAVVLTCSWPSSGRASLPSTRERSGIALAGAGFFSC